MVRGLVDVGPGGGAEAEAESRFEPGGQFWFKAWFYQGQLTVNS
jgi:hypothetical protein